jgi:hypothetical protein
MLPAVSTRVPEGVAPVVQIASPQSRSAAPWSRADGGAPGAPKDHYE